MTLFLFSENMSDLKGSFSLSDHEPAYLQVMLRVCLHSILTIPTVTCTPLQLFTLDSSFSLMEHIYPEDSDLYSLSSLQRHQVKQDSDLSSQRLAILGWLG